MPFRVFLILAGARNGDIDVGRLNNGDTAHIRAANRTIGIDNPTKTSFQISTHISYVERIIFDPRCGLPLYQDSVYLMQMRMQINNDVQLRITQDLQRHERLTNLFADLPLRASSFPSVTMTLARSSGRIRDARLGQGKA